MPWEECTSKFIRNVYPDPARINSILDLAKERWDFARSISLTEKNVSFIFDEYYEVIKELLVALMLKRGMRSGNHQCLFAFFAKDFPNYESEVNTISQMSFLRNRLEYYGERVDYTYFRENYKSFDEIVTLLFKLLK